MKRMTRADLPPSFGPTARALALSTLVLLVVAGAPDARAGIPACRYDVGNGMVFDKYTKLAWEQNMNATLGSLSAAALYCTNLDLGGFTWRLPTIQELQTIILDQPSGSTPALDTGTFQDTHGYNYGYPYWSSTPYAIDTSRAWSVNFLDGSIHDEAAGGGELEVRCVRDVAP